MGKREACLVLFSGGIDSTTALYWARALYRRVTALSFDYGQRHRIELKVARRLIRRLCLPHVTLKVDLRRIGGSSLTDRSLPLPEFKSPDEIKRGTPLTYVPFRNGIFLGLAAAWAETHGVGDIVCGFNVIDSPNYPDTRRGFVKAMEKAINLGTSGGGTSRRMRIVAPFIRLKKSEIIRKGLALGADYSYSISCYCGGEAPCGKCSSCLLRARAWREAGAADHLLERIKKERKK